jgi:hypothetical protein
METSVFTDKSIRPDNRQLAETIGDKAVSAVEKSDLPKDMISALKNARKYIEGRGLRVEVKSASDVENVKMLIDIKVKN